MKWFKLLLFISLAFTNLNAQHDLQPGYWGGALVHGEQSTELYLEFRYNDDENLAAFLTLPITNFHELSLGEVESSEEYLTAGSLQFTFSENDDEITGKFGRTERVLTYRLKPPMGCSDKRCMSNFIRFHWMN